MKDRNEMRDRIFAQFLQHAIYFLAHDAVDYERVIPVIVTSEGNNDNENIIWMRNKKIMSKILLNLIKSINPDNTPLFFYKGIVWVDPKTHYTALMEIYRQNYKTLFEPIMLAAANALGGYHSQEMKAFFEQKTIGDYNILLMAVESASVSLFKKITDKAALIYSGKTTPEYKKFIEQRNMHGSSIIQLSILSGRFLMFLHVMHLIDSIYCDDREGFVKFIRAKDCRDNSPLKLANIYHRGADGEGKEFYSRVIEYLEKNLMKNEQPKQQLGNQNSGEVKLSRLPNFHTSPNRKRARNNDDIIRIVPPKAKRFCN